MTFTTSLCLPAYAQEAFSLPAPGLMIAPSEGYVPALIKGITVHPENPLAYDFIIDNGNSGMTGESLSQESNKLIKYFLASLTVPENELWVNLSPYEKERIATDSFGRTEMGRDLLGQDYILKQLTASLIYPESDLGKEFWKRVHEKAWAQFGTPDVPVNTFNKVWIVPEQAVVYEHANSAFVVSSKLKVMLEQDYAAMAGSAESLSSAKGVATSSPQSQETNTIGSQIVREVIIPELEKEVNEGKNFANLRQIYNSMILAAWFKNNLKQSLLGQVYVDKNKVRGVDTDDPAVKEKIYQQYLEAYKKGVYNYVKEEVDPRTEDLVPRKYFSGGFMAKSSSGVTLNQMVASSLVHDAVSASSAVKPVGKVFKADVAVTENGGQGNDSSQGNILQVLGNTSASSSVDAVTNFSKWMKGPWRKSTLVDPRDYSRANLLAQTDTMVEYIKQLESHLPEIYKYAQWILDNKHYEGKKIVVLGRSAEPVYIALKTIIARNPNYTNRDNDVQLLDFSQQKVRSFIQGDRTSENKTLYSTFLRESLAGFGVDKDFSDVVFVAENETANIETQKLLAELLSKKIGFEIPRFQYIAAFSVMDEDSQLGSRYDEGVMARGTRPAWSIWLDEKYDSGREYTIVSKDGKVQLQYSNYIPQQIVNFVGVYSGIPNQEVVSSSSAVTIIRNSVAAALITLSAAAIPKDASAVSDQFAAAYHANRLANQADVKLSHSRDELNVNLTKILEEYTSKNGGQLVPVNLNAQNLHAVLKDLKTPVFDDIRKLTAQAIKSAKNDAQKTALINEMIAWVSDLLHQTASDETSSVKAHGTAMTDDWQRLIVDLGDGRKFVNSSISQFFVLLMSDLLGGEFNDMFSWVQVLIDGIGDLPDPNEIVSAIMYKPLVGETRFIDLLKGELNVKPQQLYLRDAKTADQYAIVTLGTDSADVSTMLRDYVGDTARDIRELIASTAEAIRLVDMINALPTEINNNNFEEVKGRLHDMTDRYNRLVADPYIRNHPLVMDGLQTIKEAIADNIRVLGDVARSNSPEHVIGDALFYYSKLLMEVAQAVVAVKDLDARGKQDEAQRLSDQVRTKVEQALNGLSGLPDSDVKIRIVIKPFGNGTAPGASSRDITKTMLIEELNKILKELKPLKSVNLNPALSQSSASSELVPKDVNVGGINLDPKLMNMQIRRDANGVPLPLMQQPIKDMNIEGFYPVIINIVPVENLPLLLSSSK